MSLLGDLQHIEKFGTARGPRCQVCTLFEQLSEAEAEWLNKLLDDDNVPFAWLSRALAKNGHRIGAGTLSRHKSGVCSGIGR